jgi:hypothetical protein
VGSVDEMIGIAIEPFTGDATYSTTPDAKIEVTVHAKGVSSHAIASEISPDQKCTIVAKSNLAAIQIPANGDASILDITLDVTCAKLRAGAVCAEDCTVTPSSFQLSVKGCTVSE